jgi:hypothetical protein
MDKEKEKISEEEVEGMIIEKVGRKEEKRKVEERS